MPDASSSKPTATTLPDWPRSQSTLCADLLMHFGKLSLLWVTTWVIWQAGFHDAAWHGWTVVMAWISVSLIGQISFVLRRWLSTLPERAPLLLNLVFSAELLGIVQSVRWLG